MDTFARGLQNAIKILDGGVLERAVKVSTIKPKSCVHKLILGILLMCRNGTAVMTVV